MNTQNCVTNKPIRCTTHFHACDCREYEFEQLRKENKELEYYKEQWQSIAGKANLKNLVKSADNLQKENQEMREALKWALTLIEDKLDDYSDNAKFYIMKFNLSETPNSSKEGDV